MAQHARLITPRGKRIDLSPELYRQIKLLLDAQSQRRRTTQANKIIASTYGKYASAQSLTRALLAERAAERAREDRKASLLRG